MNLSLVSGRHRISATKPSTANAKCHLPTASQMPTTKQLTASFLFTTSSSILHISPSNCVPIPSNRSSTNSLSPLPLIIVRRIELDNLYIIHTVGYVDGNMFQFHNFDFLIVGTRFDIRVVGSDVYRFKTGG